MTIEIDHAPEPTSPTGRVDSPVTCSVCGESLVLSQRERADGTLEWDHLSDAPADDVREALAWNIARAHGTPERVADHILTAFAVVPILGTASPQSAEETRERLARLVARGPEPMIHHYRVVAEILAAFEVRPYGTVTDAEKPQPVVMHIASGTGTACGLPRDRVSHITDGVRYADCVQCLRTVAQT